MSEHRVGENEIWRDLRSIDELIFPYWNVIFRLSYRILGNVEDAKDLTQETFYRAFKYIKSYKSSQNFSNWLIKVNVNACFTFLKLKNKERSSIYSRENKIASNECMIRQEGFYSDTSIYNLYELNQSLVKGTSSLSKKEKVVFLLYHMGHWEGGEIAEVLHCSPSTVRVFLYRAKKKLRQELLNQN